MIAPSNRLNSVTEYYFSKKLREIKDLENNGKPIINIAIGSPDLEPPKEILNTLKEASLMPQANTYQSYQGLPELRESMAKFYNKNFNVSLNPNSEILPLMGSKEGVMLISLAFLNAGDKVLIPNPGYPTYTSTTKLLHAEPVFYNLSEKNNWHPDFEALEKEDLSKVKLMWLNYPHMPTGTVATEELFTKLIAFAKKHKILLVNDNPYSFILNNKPMSILHFKGAKEVALELNSLSKTFNMPGWRVGMLLGKEKYIKAVLQVKSNMDSGMYFAIQKSAIVALKSADNWYTKLNAIYTKRRQLVWQILDVLNCTYNKNTSGLFVWAKVPKGTTGEALSDELLIQKNIFVSPGFIFGSQGVNYIRVSLCASEEILKTVLKRVL
ncbi:MAG: aminotransferase class I/II-fold pyridoxal phosphate-dependent enzyme [Flavobacteriaceae bacterium]